MSDLEFIKEFRKIQITKICKKVGVDYPNLISGRASKENIEKVKIELCDRIEKLMLEERKKVDEFLGEKI